MIKTADMVIDRGSYKNTVNELIKKRKELKLTQTKMATLCDVSRETISRFERMQNVSAFLLYEYTAIISDLYERGME